MEDKEILKKSISGKVISDLIYQKRLTQAQVAKALDESEQVISNYSKGKRYIGADFAAKWEKQYGEKLIDLINEALTNSTNVARGTGKHTPASNSTDNTEAAIKGEVYTNLVESNSDYRLVPKTILDGEYRIVPKSELDTWKEVLKSKNDLISRLEKEIEQWEQSGKAVARAKHT
jgi:transcriptional regulator with XRE-family HTH domain